jgi:hypothetical protein
MTSVLAMLYLILFSSLAVGFYAATNTAVQVSANERHARQAMLSTESSMELMRLVLGNVEIPPNTPSDQMWGKLCDQVAAQIDRTSNFGNATIVSPGAGAASWTLPAMTLPGGGQATITLAPHDTNVETVDVVAYGLEPDLRTDKTKGNSPLHRKIQVTFKKGPRASDIFDYGVASKSAISMSGNAQITGAAGQLARGSVLSATGNAVPLSMTGKPSISGDFSYTNTTVDPATLPVGNGSIAGYKSSDAKFADHVHAGVREPEFPTIDTSSFEKFVPASNAAPGPSLIAFDPGTRKNFTNIRIKAGVNPSFAAGTIIQGVVYVETPNKITFTGGVIIQGVIVVMNGAANDPNNPNTIKFGGNVTHQGVETLPDSGAFAGLPKLSGSFLLAPTFAVTMTGNSNNVGGTIVTSKLDISGTAGANVKGTVINLDDTAVNMTGTSDIIIQASGADHYPAGVTFGSHFTPDAKTYVELQ